MERKNKKKAQGERKLDGAAIGVNILVQGKIFAETFRQRNKHTLTKAQDKAADSRERQRERKNEGERER